MARYDDNRPDFDDGSNRDFENERATMLARFEEQLAADPRLLHYDEEEWIMLADYASDLDNFYLFSEAVMRGLIAYPDSADLSDRRLLLLNDICRPSELRKVFNDAASAPGATKIARLYREYYRWEDREDEPSTDDAYKAIRAVAIDSERLTDQETIELVRILSDMGALRLLARDIKLWSTEVEFPETLWYELAATAYEQSMFDVAGDGAELLVSSFPYNHKYWLLKARIHYLRALNTVNDEPQRNEAFDEAVDAVETACAIDPDDDEATEFRKHIDLARMEQTTLYGADANQSVSLYDATGSPMSVADFIKSTPKDVILMGMTPAMLIFLLDSEAPEARGIIAEWVMYECASLEKAYDFEFNNQHALRFYGTIETLYLMDRGDDVDLILNITEATCTDKTLFEPLLMLRLLRTLERDNLVEADRLVARMSKIYEASPDINYEIVRAIVDRRLGRTQRSDVLYNRYRTDLFTAATDLIANNNDNPSPDESGRMVVRNIYPVVSHYLLRTTLFTGEAER